MTLEQARNHQFFKNINWEKLNKGLLKPPIKPKIAKNPELGQNVPKNIKKEDFMTSISQECPGLFSQHKDLFRAFSYNTDISKFKINK